MNKVAPDFSLGMSVAVRAKKKKKKKNGESFIFSQQVKPR